MTQYKNNCIQVNKYSCLTEKSLRPNLGFMSIGKRLKLARKHAGLTQTELADKLKGIMTQQNISLLENEITTGTEYIVQLALACGVNPQWLAMGEGEMLTGNLAYLSQEMQAHLIVLQELPEYARTEVIRDAIKTAELITKATSAASKNNGTDHK